MPHSVEAQLPLRNRASAVHFFVAKLLYITVMTYSYVCHLRNLRPANLLRTQRINFSMRPQHVRITRDPTVMLAGRLRSSKAVDFGTNRKQVCDFLLVIHSRLDSILLRFRDVAGFLRRTATPPLFHSNFGVFPLDLVAVVGAPRSEDPKLS